MGFRSRVEQGMSLPVRQKKELLIYLKINSHHPKKSPFPCESSSIREGMGMGDAVYQNPAR